MSSQVDVKVVLLGAASAGKTTLVERYLNKRFLDTPQTTIGAAFNAKKISINDETITLGLWDTAGTERYKSMSRIYYKGAAAALVCFDVRSTDSYENVKFWINELRDAEPNCLLFIVACKTDLKDETSVDQTAVRNYASSIGAQVYETSSKTGKGVDELFFSVVEAAIKKNGKFNSGLERSTVKLDKLASVDQQSSWWSRWC